ncbi:MAG: Abi family protein [Acholeplasma sp.]|nr:Abi family protein [Acholeplasma sp.]
MNKVILTDNQLKMKLTNYKFIFTSDEFEELKRLGFYHVFNSLVEKSVRNDGNNKNLSDYLKLYHIDFNLRSLIFPMILGVESVFKQRLNDTFIEEILANTSNSPHYNEVVKLCIKSQSNIKIKKTLFKSSSHRSQIVSHFFDNHNDIPIWAYFELLDLGSFLEILENSTDKDDLPKGRNRIKEKFSDKCKFLQTNGNQFAMNQKCSYIYESLRLVHAVRNHVAHNQPIIDCRYNNTGYGLKASKISAMILDISQRTNPGLSTPSSSVYDFKSVTDAITVIYLLYVFMLGKDRISDRLRSFVKDEIMSNTSSIDLRIHSKVFGAHNLIKAQLILDL